jgi:hypothetical protein
MTRDEMNAIAEQAAEEALKKMLLALGINAYTPEAMQAFQKDMAFTRALRESSDAVKRKAMLTAVGVLITGVLGYLWLAFKGNP